MILQNDPKWKNVKIWDTDYSLGSYGCYITSLAYLCGKTPPEVNQILGEGGCIHNGMITNPARVADLLGLEYQGVAITDPGGLCIGETTYFAPKVPQHFVVIDNDKILDPLGKNIKYPIKTYRLYRRRNMFNEDQINQIKANLTDGGSWVNDNGWELVQEAIGKVTDNNKANEKILNELKKGNDERDARIREMQGIIDDLASGNNEDWETIKKAIKIIKEL